MPLTNEPVVNIVIRTVTILLYFRTKNIPSNEGGEKIMAKIKKKFVMMRVQTARAVNRICEKIDYYPAPARRFVSRQIVYATDYITRNGLI